MSLNILHLSDIHFKYEVHGTVYDLDQDVRNELELDVEDIVKRSGPINAVVVTGDIAFAGRKQDYLAAQHWLKKLCERIGCEAEHVWVVPGNHDVDRAKVTPTVRRIQDSIQTALLTKVDDGIREVVHTDPDGEELLLRPQSEYQEFSAKYGCKPLLGDLAWQSDLKLNAGYTLRLAGVNSALVSNDEDHETKRKLILGNAQLKLPRSPGVLYLTLCHHPHNWLKDIDNVVTKLRKRVSLQLYGHIHQHAIQQDDRTLVVQAGALQPDRGEDPWYPTYNVLALEVTTVNKKHCLSVTAYPRKWSVDHEFGADGGINESQKFTLPIDDKLSLADTTIPLDQEKTSIGEPLVAEEEGIDVRYSMTDPAKQLVYAYLTLPYTKQLRIADRLNLLADDDAGLTSDELFEQIFLRAQERNLLTQLWSNVSDEQPDLEMGDNPYNGN